MDDAVPRRSVLKKVLKKKFLGSKVILVSRREHIDYFTIFTSSFTAITLTNDLDINGYVYLKENLNRRIVKNNLTEKRR